MRKIMVKLYDFLEKKLYSEPTFNEMAKFLDKTRNELFDARQEINYLKSLIRDKVGR